MHITLELPFNSQQLVQQLGRSHRSNQVRGPEYLCVVSELPGEVRFASTASKRLMAMGAITQVGKRRNPCNASFLFRWPAHCIDGWMDGCLVQTLTSAPFLPLDDNTHTQQGDRMACMGSEALLDFDIDTKWGIQAL